uniref:Uncharacterized protein n=1 Tax=Rhizophagus irregularis (strain DAOM 181602 / DAOM 197198 / MUCL 43194) TaxID=747089 RepID=U9UWN4_RHIID
MHWINTTLSDDKPSCKLKYIEIVNCDIVDGYFNVANEFGVKLIKVSESHEIRLGWPF